MYRFILVFVVFFINPLPVMAASADVKLLRQARSQVMIVAGEMKQRINEEIRGKGEASVLSSCRIHFADVTERLSDHSGWSIRRTSLKVRNPLNAPDEWEREVLNLFAKRQQEGVALQDFEFAKLLSVDGRRVFRYMKPIIIQDSCLPCHGKAVAPSVADKIAEKFPGDQTTGFDLGDLGGAFSLQKHLPGDLP